MEGRERNMEIPREDERRCATSDPLLIHDEGNPLVRA